MTKEKAQDASSVVDRRGWTYADDPDLVADPWTTWDRLRDESRAFVSTEAAKDWDVWTLLRYDDVHAGARLRGGAGCGGGHSARQPGAALQRASGGLSARMA